LRPTAATVARALDRGLRLARQLPAATRHGFSSRTGLRIEVSPELERYAKPLCEGTNDPLLLEQALVVARNEHVLQAIAAQRTAVIERLRDPRFIALAKGDNSLKLGEAIAAIGRVFSIRRHCHFVQFSVAEYEHFILCMGLFSKKTIK
jgi:hypothetical protein